MINDIDLNKHASVQRCDQLTRELFTSTSFFPAEKGIKLVQEGQYAQAVAMFTDAIKCDPKDNRYIICCQFITEGLHIF